MTKMAIMIVSPEQVPGPQAMNYGDVTVYFRSMLSGLKSISPDLLILLPGCSEEQKLYSKDKLRASGGRLIEL